MAEPTETEGKATLDHFIETMRRLAERAKSGDAAFFQEAPAQGRGG